MKISSAFEAFIMEGGLAVEWYISQLEHNIPRFIRLHHSLQASDIDLIESELGCSLAKVTWLDGFYSIPSPVKINELSYYKKGLIYGIDVASGVAVKALDIQDSDHVLDVCCAPGSKLLMISEQMNKSIAATDLRALTGSITGVDISKLRLFTCRSMAKKHKVKNLRLFCSDATTFDVNTPNVDSRINRKDTIDASIDMDEFIKPLHRSSTLARDTQKKRGSLSLYDKVLVDAECTHDGSIAHILKFDKEGGEEKFDALVLDVDRLKRLQTLQASYPKSSLNIKVALLNNGYRLLKPGGILVYSTCSFFQAQNEDVVNLFLSTNDTALIEELPQADLYPATRSLVLEGAIKFSPTVSNTSGLFICRIRRRIK